MAFLLLAAGAAAAAYDARVHDALVSSTAPHTAYLSAAVAPDVTRLDAAYRDDAPGSSWVPLTLLMDAAPLDAAPLDAAPLDAAPLDGTDTARHHRAACAAAAAPGNAARRCAWTVTGLLPDRRYRFRVGAAAAGELAGSARGGFSAHELQLLTAVETDWVVVQGAAEPSAARLLLGELAAPHVGDTSAVLAAVLTGLPATRSDAQRLVAGLALAADVEYARAAGDAQPSGWEPVVVSQPAIQLAPVDDRDDGGGDGAPSSSVAAPAAATAAHLRVNITGLRAGAHMRVRLSARVALAAAAPLAASSHAAATLGVSAPVPADGAPQATAFSHALALETLPAPPPPPVLRALARADIGVHEVRIQLQQQQQQQQQQQLEGEGEDEGGSGRSASLHPSLALLGYSLQLRALPLKTPPPPPLDESGATAQQQQLLQQQPQQQPQPPQQPQPQSQLDDDDDGWVAVAVGVNRSVLLASLAAASRPQPPPSGVHDDDDELRLQVICVANGSAVAPSAYAFDVAGHFGATRDGRLYGELSLAAQSPHGGGRDACGSYAYTLRIGGLDAATLYQMRARTYAQRVGRRSSDDDSHEPSRSSSAAASEGAAPAVDTRAAVTGPWSRASPRFRTRALPRGVRDLPAPLRERAASLPPPAASGWAAAGSSLPLAPRQPAPPRLSGVTSASASLSWRELRWPPPRAESGGPGAAGAAGAPAAAYALELALGPADDAFTEVWRGVGVNARLAELQPSAAYRVRLLAIASDGVHSPPSDPLGFSTRAQELSSWQQLVLAPAAAEAAVGAASGGEPPALDASGVPRLAPRLPPPLEGASLTVLGAHAYLFGGLSTAGGHSCALGALSAACRTGAQLRAETWRLQLGTMRWDLLAPPSAPPARSHHVAMALAGEIYVWAGYADATAAADASGAIQAAGAYEASSSTGENGVPLLHADMWRLDVGASGRSTRVTRHAGGSANATLPPEQALWLPLSVPKDPAPAAPEAGSSSNSSSSSSSSVAPGSCVASIEVTVVIAHDDPTRVALTLVGAAPTEPHAASAGAHPPFRGSGALEAVLRPPRAAPRGGWDDASEARDAWAPLPASAAAPGAATTAFVFRSTLGEAVLASCAAGGGSGGFVDTWRGCGGASSRGPTGDTDDGGGDGEAVVVVTTSALDAFIGAPAAGAWQLRVADARGGVVGGRGSNATAAVVVTRWQIRLLSSPCVPRAEWHVVNATGLALIAAAGGGTQAPPLSSPALPPPRASAAAVSLADSLFITGGVGQLWLGGAAFDDGGGAMSANSSSSGNRSSSGPRLLDLASTSTHDVWRFDAASSAWTQLAAPAYASAALSADAASPSGVAAISAAAAGDAGAGGGGMVGAALAVAGPPLSVAIAFGGLRRAVANDTGGAVATCTRYPPPSHGSVGGIPRYLVRADEVFACEGAAATHSTLHWDAPSGSWARLHPSLDPAAPSCLGARWCRTPHPRAHAAMVVVLPPLGVAADDAVEAPWLQGQDSSSYTHSTHQQAAPRLLLYGGRPTDADSSMGSLGDLWSLELSDALGRLGARSPPTWAQLAEGVGAPAQAAAGAERCRDERGSSSRDVLLLPCLAANATGAWRARRPCSWAALLEAAALAC